MITRLFLAQLLACIGLTLAGAARADDIKLSDLPQVVRHALQERYPDAEVDEIDTHDDDDGYEIELEVGNDDIDLTLGNDGTFISERREIRYHQLPRPIATLLEQDFADWGHDGIKLRTRASGAVTCEIELEHIFSNREMDLTVALDGTVLEQEEKGAKTQDDAFRFRQRAGEMDILLDGKPFATYVWSDPQTTRPYFKQVHAAGGDVQITRNHPPGPDDFADHETYHPGIWWGFGDVGGHDYWRMKARIIGGYFVEEPTTSGDRASFAVRNRLLTGDGSETFCEQVCRYTILRRPLGILMICESTFLREASDFWLGDQEEMGLAVRVATPLATKSENGGSMRDSAGRTLPAEIRTNQSDWCDYSGPIEGRHGGILVMNDPQNFRRPWWHAVDTGLLIANPLGESELTGNGKRRENVLVKKGESFRLRYGVLIHLHEQADQFDCGQAYADFRQLLPEVQRTRRAEVRTDLPQVPDGFEISIYTREPSVYKPTAICFDRQGRLLVGQGPQYPKNFHRTPPDSVVLLIDSDHDSVVDETKTFATGFNSVQGLAWKGNDLYVANAPELTVVRDLDGDDEADEYVVVYTDLGNREHALHGLNWGPDGKLYMSKGNSKGHNQPEKYGNVAPRAFRELWDVTHPPGAPDSYPPRTFTKHDYQKTYHNWEDDWGREGGVLRCDPLGANLEIFSRGMRNPWDITFDDGFNFLGTDNDQEQGDRIMMPFFGAHFGWGHSYSSHWTGENHLPTAPVSGPVFHGSGTGITFATHPHLPPRYRHVFFINDWLHGTHVYRPVWDGALMQPAGGRWEQFAVRGQGEMHYRPTDLEFGPDGALYICGWGDDYHYYRGAEGSFMFRVTPTDPPASTPAAGPARDRTNPDSARNFEELLADLGSDAIPVWRVNAQDELVRRGDTVRDELIDAIESRRLASGQQTWAVWALARMKTGDTVIWDYLKRLAAGPDQPAGLTRVPVNLRIQAIRSLAHIVRQSTSRELPAAVVAAALADPEPRIRFAAVQAVWQTEQAEWSPALVDELAMEQDRLVFYAGWRALRELADAEFRKQLLVDERPAVRLAGLLSLLEGHQIALDDVLAIAERDPDERIQHWAMTWAMNPRPPEKMPNATARVELEESVSMSDLIERVKKAKNARLRQLYLSMISRATYRDDEDWDELHAFYLSLPDDDQRAHLIPPLARENHAARLLWEALDGSDALRQAAVKGLGSLSRRTGNSPEQMAAFLLTELAAEPDGPRVTGAIEVLSGLNLSDTWRPPDGWDATLALILETTGEVGLQEKILTVLLAVDPDQLATGIQTRRVVEQIARAPHPRLYASLRVLNPRLGIDVVMQPPEEATMDGVLAELPQADAARGYELFFSGTVATNCVSCHRLAGRGAALAPDLSGIGLRAQPTKIIQSILDPSATITEGFELQTFIMDDGLVLSGAVLHENDAQIRLVKSDATVETIDAQAVESRTKTKVSAMPSGFALLGNEQVADIVAFLSTCRHGPAEPERPPNTE